MKKILLSIMIIAVVIAIAAGGTMAYFNSSSTTPVTFGAATFNVSLGTESTPLAFDGLIPGGPAKQTTMTVRNDGEMDAFVRAFPSAWTGNSALLNSLWVKVTLQGNGSTSYPDGNTYTAYEGRLVDLMIENVTHNNPIKPGQVGTYVVEVSLPFSAPASVAGKTAGCNLIFQATQSVGQGSTIQW